MVFNEAVVYGYRVLMKDSVDEKSFLFAIDVNNANSRSYAMSSAKIEFPEALIIDVKAIVKFQEISV